MKSIVNYDGIKVLEIIDELPDRNNDGVDFIRVILPATFENREYMLKRGFLYGDRTLDVSVNLNRSKTDYKKMIRIKPDLINYNTPEIIEIAKKSFPTDRRFNLSKTYNAENAEHILNCWIQEAQMFIICRFHEEIVGFIVPKIVTEDTLSIHLAAVKEKYRAAGIATSLYASAIQYAIDNGYKHVIGTISTANTAVMNLYAYLGASFLNPKEMFLKEVHKNNEL